jgi:hypothetical protein
VPIILDVSGIGDDIAMLARPDKPNKNLKAIVD